MNARWDRRLANSSGEPQSQERGIYYAARDAKTCLAEAFQQTRRIDRAFQAPWLVVFETVSPLMVLDLTGNFATRMGASMAIHSGSRERAGRCGEGTRRSAVEVAVGSDRIAACCVLASDRIAILKRHWITAALFYGAIIFFVMNYVVVPLSAVREIHAFSTEWFVENMSAMLLFGLIIVFVSNRSLREPENE